MHCVNPWDLNLPTTSLKSFLWNWKTYVLKMPTSSACPIHAAVMRCCFWFSVRMPNTCSSDALLLLIQCMLPTRQCTRDHGGLPMQCVAPCRQGTRGCLRRVLGATHKGLRIRGYAQGTTHKGLRTRGYAQEATDKGLRTRGCARRYKGLRTRGYAQGATRKGLRTRGYAQGDTHKGLRTRGYAPFKLLFTSSYRLFYTSFVWCTAARYCHTLVLDTPFVWCTAA